MNEYVSTVIIMSVALGTVALVFCGFRLSGTFRTLLSLVMTAAAVLPLINFTGDFERELDFSFEAETAQYSSEMELYLDYSKMEIEKRLSEMLCERFGDDFKVTLTLDASDMSAVLIEKVDVVLNESSRQNEKEIQKLMKDNTACKSISFIYADEQIQYNGGET